MKKNSEIEKLKEENKKLKKLLAVRSDIVSVSAHQIRTSLSALKWIVKMFLDGDLGKITTEQKKMMRKAFDGVERTIGMIGDLLLINKTEENIEKKYAYSKVDVVELINNVIFDFSGEAHIKGIKIIFLKPSSKNLYLNADKDKIRIIFQNLLENAIKYNKLHGKIFITSKKVGDMIQISIKDTGIGISEEGKKKIFEKFFRDKEAKKKKTNGSGIGLFTSKQIVEKHGGKMWFKSDKKNGTTFFFTIPIYKD